MSRVMAWLRRRLSVRVEIGLDVLRDPGFVAVDLETTGLDPRRDAIVSMAAIPFVHGEPQRGYVTVVDPGRPIPVASTRIHGIDDARVAGAPSLDAALPQFDAVCTERVVVGHDVGFDLAFLDRARRRHARLRTTLIALDTRRLVIALHPSWRRDVELEIVAERLGIPVVGRHTAEGDANLAGAILLALLPEFRARGVNTVNDLVWAQSAVYRRA